MDRPTISDLIDRLGIVAFNHGMLCAESSIMGKPFDDATKEGNRRAYLDAELRARVAELEAQAAGVDEAAIERWRRRAHCTLLCRGDESESCDLCNDTSSAIGEALRLMRAAKPCPDCQSKESRDG